jgi:hypothetical protein
MDEERKKKRHIVKANKIRLLIKWYEGKAAKARLNIEVYLENSAGIGEHSDIAEAIDIEVGRYASAIERIEALEKIQREL